ncbi:hypothetical protein H0H87_008067 [Tephrocybe sp. NHM501043]|nr:hypothetical protein H0H87_008067 [Tephrocybe sp. NHM501043]
MQITSFTSRLNSSSTTSLTQPSANFYGTSSHYFSTKLGLPLKDAPAFDTAQWSREPTKAKTDAQLLAYTLPPNATIIDFVAMAIGISNVAVRYRLRSQNCYYFAACMVHLTRRIFADAKTIEEPLTTANSTIPTMGTWHHIPVLDLALVEEKIGRMEEECQKIRNHMYKEVHAWEERKRREAEEILILTSTLEEKRQQEAKRDDEIHKLIDREAKKDIEMRKLIDREAKKDVEMRKLHDQIRELMDRLAACDDSATSMVAAHDSDDLRQE